MRSTPVARRLHHMISAVTVGLAVSLSSAAEARGGGGGGGMGGFHGGAGMGAFHGGGMGAFHGGGVDAFHGSFFRGGIVAAPGRAVGHFGFGMQGVHRSHRGAPPFGRVTFGLRGPRASRFGTFGIPPLAGLAVPPLIGTAVLPFGSVVAPPPVRPGVHVVEIWRRQGEVWHHEFAEPSGAIWRGQDGRWLSEAAE